MLKFQCKNCTYCFLYCVMNSILRNDCLNFQAHRRVNRCCLFANYIIIILCLHIGNIATSVLYPMNLKIKTVISYNHIFMRILNNLDDNLHHLQWFLEEYSWAALQKINKYALGTQRSYTRSAHVYRFINLLSYPACL
jgi:hypothetical protein